MTLSYPMPDEVKVGIDIGLLSKEPKDIETSMGVLKWDYIKSKYKNLEPGLADRIRKERAGKLEDMVTASQEEFDDAIDLLVDYEKRLKNGSLMNSEYVDNAFSEDKPMTYQDFCIWQKAIAVFIENIYGFFPDVPERSYEAIVYREFKISKLKIQAYFISYLDNLVYLEFHRHPIFKKRYRKVVENENVFDVASLLKKEDEEKEQFLGHELSWMNSNMMICEDYSDIAIMYPFVLGFAERYFGEKVGQGMFRGKLWDIDSIVSIDCKIENVPTRVRVFFKFEDKEWGNEDFDYIERYAPYYQRYYLKDGKIGYWYNSHAQEKPWLREDMDMLDAYFERYPDKREIYDEALIKHKEAYYKREANKNSIEEIKKRIDEYHGRYKEIKEEIDTLKKKLFGRKAASIKIDELEKELDLLKDKKTSAEGNIKSLEIQNEKIAKENGYDFYKRLVSEMDGFLVIEWVEE